jgi:aquaporin Z
MKKQLMAEFFGTAWLVLGGCGTAVLAGSGVGTLGIALAFGLSVLTMAYAVGHISGGHFNPAVTVGMVTSGRFCAKSALPYIISQVLGGLLGAAIIYYIAGGKEGFDVTKGFASNGYGEHSPGGYSMNAVLLTEAALTFFFVFIILGATKEGAPKKFAGLAIGLALTLVHLISIPVSNTSVNPARSTSQAVFEGGWALDQLWLFWAAPIAGAIIAGLVFRCLCCEGSGCGTSSCSTQKTACSTDGKEKKGGCCG